MMIEVNNVSKEFKVYTRPSGFINTVKSAFWREHKIKRAVTNICFNIEPGELVGYVGPNGAGKSTTIKMLSGILTPSAGDIRVLGIVPYKQRMKNAKNIGVVFGQRSQLYWDLPVRDSFVLHEKMYDIPKPIFKDNVKLFTEILQMEEFIDQPVRQLSLGQKMRANLAIALLHNPPVIYLDEPTVGLDIVAKAAIREFIKEINKMQKTTVIITTHDMTDIEEICQRLILIDKGQLYYDGDLHFFKQQYGGDYVITIQVKSNSINPQHPMLSVVEKEANRIVIKGNSAELSLVDAIDFYNRNYEIIDIGIKESSIESILRDIYTGSIQMQQ